MILEFIWKYLAGPVMADAQNAETAVWNGITAHTGYNPYNTVAWALIAITAILLIRREFDRRDIQLTTQTAINSIPFIILGGVLRFLEDAAVLPFVLRPLAITPIIYLVIAGLFLASLPLASKLASRSSCTRDDLLKNLGYVYLAPFLALTVYTLMGGADIILVLTPVVIASVLTGLYYAVTRRNSYSNIEYLLIAFSQFFGGAASMVSISQGYQQKQLLTQAFTSLFGEPGIIILKAGIIGLAVYTLEKDIDEEQMKALALIVLYSIGLATGLRVLLRLSMGI